MQRVFALRYFAIAALIFAFGIGDLAVAATSDPSQQLHRQDMGDDDGDGIPNQIDPDDNRDGIADRDTPLPVEDDTDGDITTPETPDDIVDDPDTVNEDVTDPIDSTPQEPNLNTDQEPQAVVPPAPQQAEVPQVAALPNTGIGPNSEATHGPDLLLIGLLSTCIFLVSRSSRHQMP